MTDSQLPNEFWAMTTPNEFWLRLNNLSQAYLDEGLTPEERLANILDEFEKLPPTVRRHVLDNIRSLSQHVPDIFLSARAKHAELEKSKQSPDSAAG
jgi:hypothetical protein